MSEFVGVSGRLIYAGVRVNRSCGIRKKYHRKSANRAFGYEKKLTEIVEVVTVNSYANTFSYVENIFMPTPIPGATTVSITPTTQTVPAGSSFTVSVAMYPEVAIAGAQLDLSFDPSLVRANSITEGNLLKQDGASTYFSLGTIDNTAGTIADVAGVITTAGETVSSPGVFATIQMTAQLVEGTTTVDLSNVIVGDIHGTPVSITVNDGSVTVGKLGCFDTGSGTYPSIFGTHTGKITPGQTITVSKLYTYPCPGTGGHSEYVRIYGNRVDVSKTWSGYTGDYSNITFDTPFTLEAGETYNYELRTGSYPQILHATSKSVTGGTITCIKFVDANGKEYNNRIPAIRLEHNL